MHQRSDIFTIRNIFTLILLGVMIIGLYSYHNVSYRLSTSTSTMKSLKLQMEASDSQLRNAIKSKTACFKDVMQLRASTIDMKTKLSEAETELAKQRHDTASKMTRCSEEVKTLKTQLVTLQNEIQALKESDRSNIQKKKEEEEEKEKKLKEMTADHELKVSKLKDEVADLQKDKSSLQTRLDTALAESSKLKTALGKSPTLTTKKEDLPLRVEPDSARQMQPPARKFRDNGKYRSVQMKQPVQEPIKTEAEGKNIVKEGEELKKEEKKRDPLAAPAQRALGGPGVDEEDREADKAAVLKEQEKRGQQLDMPVARDGALKPKKEPNQLPRPAGADSEPKADTGRRQQIRPAAGGEDEDSKELGGGVQVDY